MASETLGSIPGREREFSSGPYFGAGERALRERMIVMLRPSARLRPARFDLHRALRSLPLRTRAALELVVLVIAFLAITGYALAPMVEIWRIVLDAVFGWLQLPARVHSGSVSLIANLKLPIVDVQLAGQAPSSVQWGATLLLTVGMVAFALRPKTPVPARYFAMLLACVITVALVFFAIAPERFPYSVGRHVGDGLTMIEVLIMTVPLLFGGTYYVFDFSVVQKTVLTAITITFLAIAGPLQYAVHAWVIESLSLLWLPPLYLLFGIVLDIMTIIAVYSWAMSWPRSGCAAGVASTWQTLYAGRKAGEPVNVSKPSFNAMLNMEHAALTHPMSPAGTAAGAARAPAAVDDVGHCTFCGVCRFCSSHTALSGKFCSECGSPLHLKPCSSCGTVNECGSGQCTACGARFTVPAPSTIRPCPTHAQLNVSMRDRQPEASPREEIAHDDSALDQVPARSAQQSAIAEIGRSVEQPEFQGLAACGSIQAATAKKLANRRTMLTRGSAVIASAITIVFVAWLALRLDVTGLQISHAAAGGRTVEPSSILETSAQTSNSPVPSMHLASDVAPAVNQVMSGIASPISPSTSEIGAGTVSRPSELSSSARSGTDAPIERRPRAVDRVSTRQAASASHRPSTARVAAMDKPMSGVSSRVSVHAPAIEQPSSNRNSHRGCSLEAVVLRLCD